MNQNTNRRESNISSSEFLFSEKETSEEKDPIADLYKSLSNIVESLNTDNLLLNKQVGQIRSELDIVFNRLSDISDTFDNKDQVLKELKEKTDICFSKYESKDQILKELKEKTDIIIGMQKYITETRNILIQTLNANMKIIKKEISVNNKLDDDIKLYIHKYVNELLNR